MALESIAIELAQAMNFGRSADGKPNSSQITASGSMRA